ncbi:MAG: SAM-dependent methyltransferase, partial [Nocardioidaceae bacterium]
IWSFWLLRDSAAVEPTEENDATHLAKWPGSLKRYLDGHARLVVREHVGEEVAFDADLQFGTADDDISITDSDGRPLATDKTGELHRVFAGGDERDREALLDTIEDVLAALSEIDIGAFPAYGTLLGAVRNQKLIGHDSDADLAYVSAYTTPVDLILESYRIDRHLRSHGYSVQRHSAFAMKIYVEEADGSERGLDVFGAAFVDGRLYVMGEIGVEFDRDQVYPLGTCTLEGRTLPAPADADAWLEITYGPSWKVPDPAFHFGTPESTRRRLNGWFRGTRRFRDDWDGYWQRNHAGTKAPSNFTRWVHREEPDADVVVDIGSGRGFDVMWHASQGRRAIGLDYSHSALRNARNQAEQQGPGAEYEMLNLCDMRSVLAVGTWIARLPGRRAVTARLLVCSLDRRGRKNFWRLCSMVARDGSRVYLQIVDPQQTGAGVPYRRLLRPVRTGTVIEEIGASGGHILDQTVVEPEGSGDQPRYTRMVVTWEKYASDSEQ